MLLACCLPHECRSINCNVLDAIYFHSKEKSIQHIEHFLIIEIIHEEKMGRRIRMNEM
jgi:hypothetical protein